jgi:hypothetical protein
MHFDASNYIEIWFWNRPLIRKMLSVDNILCYRDALGDFIVTSYPDISEMQGDCKWCQRLHTFIGKRVIVTQKLNSCNCVEQLKHFLFACAML